MEVIILSDPEAAATVAADLISAQVIRKPDSILGLATGGTPVLLYRELINRHVEQHLDFRNVTTFNLDEYVGLGPDHPASYKRFMNEHLFVGINADVTKCHIPDGLTTDVPSHCAEYEAAISAAGGIDLQLLGLGSDGHIGFNEPGSSLTSRTRVKTLTERTRNDNLRFFGPGETPPHHVITMGLGTIMESRTCLLLAFGPGKADAVRAMVEGPVTANVPASVLQFHSNTKVVLDEKAAAKLDRADYYRFVYENKPAWQRELELGKH